MPYTRVIPVVLLKHGLLVRSQEFKTHQVIGNPISTIHRYSSWDLDELILLDISQEDHHDLRRNDLQIEYKGDSFLELIPEVASVCSMPFTVGGRIKNLNDIEVRLEKGADKCSINTASINDPKLIEESSRRFGCQCIVVSIDVKREADGTLNIWKSGGREKTDLNVLDWVKKVQDLGAGEILINSIDRDGTGNGYDKELVAEVVELAQIPVISCGGVGKYQDFTELAKSTKVSALAAANIFHFRELSYPFIKKECLKSKINVRPSFIGESKWFKREPEYSNQRKEKRISKTLNHKNTANISCIGNNINWCSRCVAPAISATPLEFDEKGVCTACQMADCKKEISKGHWKKRHDQLSVLLDKYRSKDGSNYDCIIAVSGGKDSYFQAHYLKNEMGMNPLLITYNGNNWLPVGWRNMLNMKEVFGLDHILYSPSIDLLKKLNRQGFIVMGDMNWHAHTGISTVPMQAGIQHQIPLVFYGEHGYTELGGQFSLNDFPEVSYRYRLEHFCRSYEWNYFLGLENISSSDMKLFKYPTDQQMMNLDLRGIFLGNYVYWEANEHTQLVVDKYDFEVSNEPFDRTYRTMSNLDDMHENGLHDYLKFIKFGYGRGTDHACKDIRAGKMSREEGIEMVRKYDHVKPSDMKRWSDYTGISEDEFDRIADSFRDPRVWSRENSAWKKQNIWD
jgi:imidazoleglycerol phosphate synthase cyclase subunit